MILKSAQNFQTKKNNIILNSKYFCKKTIYMLATNSQINEIDELLEKYDVNISVMCKKLEMNRKTFYNKLDKEKNSFFTITEYEKIRKFILRE